VNCTSLAKIEAMSDHMKRLWADPEGPSKDMKAYWADPEGPYKNVWKLIEAHWADPEGPYKNMKAIMKELWDDLWAEQRNQLADFKKQFHYTNVLQQYAENMPLGLWVNNQRSLYKLLKANKLSHMTSDRIQSLEKVGFEWVVHSRYLLYYYTWEEQRQQLADFKNEFHHTNVPQRYTENKSLGSWVKTQMLSFGFTLIPIIHTNCLSYICTVYHTYI